MTLLRPVRDVAAMCALGVVGSFFFMLLPLLVAALVRGGYAEQTAGLVGSAPLAGMFVGSIVCAGALQRLRGRLVASLALGAMATANGVSAYAQGNVELLLALQFCAGFAGVVLMSLTFAFLSERTAPDSYFAFFIALQMAVGALATLLVERIAAEDGARPIFGFLAICAVGGISLVFLMPQPSGETPRSSPVLAGALRLLASPGSLAVLATQVIFGAGIMLIWSYAARIGESHGLPRAAVAGALSASLLSSIVGALCASAIGRRIRVDVSLAAASALMVASAVLVINASTPGAFFFAIALFGFGWNFMPAFQLGIAADLDPSGRLVVLNIALVKLGYAIGTASGGMLVTLDSAYRLHALAASACFAGALITAMLARSRASNPVRGSSGAARELIDVNAARRKGSI